METKNNEAFLRKCKNHNITLDDINQIIQLYTVNKLGRQKIANQFNISEYFVKEILKNYNIHIRNHQEANNIINENRKYKCNENYFKKESHEMAWLLGFIASDGCIDNRNRLTFLISQKDKEILYKIHKILGCEDSIKIKEYEDSNGHDVCRLEITSRIIKDDLAKYNIVPRKTFVFSFPTNLSKEYWIDFIRGYWDGDGWISRNDHSTIWGIVAATKLTLEPISSFLEELGLSHKELYTRYRNGSINYYLQYNTRDSNKLYELLYNDNICLERKYKHFTEIYNQYKGRPELLK